MDAIKKKMQAMKLEKDNAMDKADTSEQQARDANLRADKVNEEVRELQKKLLQVEEDLVLNKNKLEQANKDLEEKEKLLTSTEADVAAMNRKVQQIEEDLEKSEERSGTAQQKLLEAQQSADENNRLLVIPQVSRKLAFVEDELEVAEDLSEEKANQRVEEFKKQLKTLTGKLKEAEARAEFAEKTVKKLQKEVDRLEDTLFSQKEKYKAICDDLDGTFAELTGY
ncbi:Tropomyosin-1 [Operophtera brumata]|uniref:Tropomyosin-1 n=1 Tax=Operophtera brumata TaxID=104452 RepID=A0A0L7LTW9_OPEBR|nr:Tropomyosin-1 [Operophtera brumata]